MENTTQQTFRESIANLRKMIQLINQSVDKGYLRNTWKQDDKGNNYESILLTESGYYAFNEDCIIAEDRIFHEVEDSDVYVYDEIDECYICEGNAAYVNGRRMGYHTHIDNCNGANEIYRYEGEYINDAYMDYNNLVFDCHGNIGHTDDLYYWECDGEYHGEPEEDEEEEEDENSDMESAFINSYSFRPSMKFCSLSNENKNAPFFGIELEVERKNSNGLKHKYMAGMIQHDHWYFKTDGSLTDGFEIVSHPMTFNYIKQSEKTFADSLKLLVENGYNSYDANTCGMHIHISKANFTTWHLYRFLKFFVENKEFIVSISQRKMEKLKKWANIEDDNDSSLILTFRSFIIL